MKYTVQKLEVKQTSTGKTKMDVELLSADGVVVPEATIWSDFPGFESITFGTEVEGDLVAAKDPKYGPTLYPLRKSTGKAIGAGLKAAQERKSDMIQKSQENKEWGIMTSSTIRMATDVAIAEGNPSQENILKWREWFIANWDISATDKPAFQ